LLTRSHLKRSNKSPLLCRKTKPRALTTFQSSFFQKYWDIISANIQNVVTTFYHNKLDLWRINQAYITLIPKKAGSTILSDYRPINVLLAIPKILTKILATRLQPFLSNLIHKNQTTFIKGQQLIQTFISNRKLLIHFAKNKIPSVFLKIDFQKAFDSLSWDYLLEVLRAREFPGWYGYVASSFLLPLISKSMGLKVILSTTVRYYARGNLIPATLQSSGRHSSRDDT
jgi:Reverse transcriptase (RNA-dependent DNA polymerase)